jgi:hypothetical protein
MIFHESPSIVKVLRYFLELACWVLAEAKQLRCISLANSVCACWVLAEAKQLGCISLANSVCAL